MTALPGAGRGRSEGARPGVSADADPGVELVERAVGYTRVALATVTPAHLCLPTPCDLWRLGDLLAHMEDALDAFAEGATGAIGLRGTAPAPLDERIGALQRKACHLLGVWASAASASRSSTVEVGDRPVVVGTVTRVAALEIAVHGWDVGRTTGGAAPLPDGLAEALLPTAVAVAASGRAGGEFAAPVAVGPGAGAAEHLLGLLGRSAHR